VRASNDRHYNLELTSNVGVSLRIQGGPKKRDHLGFFVNNSVKN